VTELPGKLYNIEQHTDGVVIEFSLNFLLQDNSYQRYFVIQIGKNELVYLGSDITKSDPSTHIFFTPT
jgi:hypothetical protein